MVTISKCRTKKELSLFEKIPQLLNGQDVYFVPPFPGSIVKLIGPKSPFYKHGDLVAMIAYREGKPVGRIAAIENRVHNEYYQDKVGFFGFFDVIDDISVSQALMSAAEAELKIRGLTSIRGPYNPTVNDECGLLVEGFDSPPMIMMSYNPRYYLELYEKVGLRGVRDLHAYYISNQVPIAEKLIRVAERFNKSGKVTIRHLEMAKLKDELKIIHELYNSTLNRNWGFIPLALEDLEFAANDLKAFVEPEHVLIAEKEGEPVGFSMLLPNINELMWKCRKSSTLVKMIKFIWNLKMNPPKEARLAVLGVKPEFQASGVASVFYLEAIRRGGKRFAGAECSWIEESNTAMMRSLELLGAKKYKNYRIFEKPL
ncbi:MAG: GNAT family N-acetyltransferase [Deltaproteobacteria bacterium]